MYLTETGQDFAQCINSNKDTIKQHWRFPQKGGNSRVSVT